MFLYTPSNSTQKEHFQYVFLVGNSADFVFKWCSNRLTIRLLLGLNYYAKGNETHSKIAEKLLYKSTHHIFRLRRI